MVSKDRLLIFNYHQVSKEFNPKTNIAGIWTQLDFFYEQVSYLKNNYEIINLDDAINDLDRGTHKGTKIALTFDDGDKSIEEHVLPILEAESIPASIFINSAYVDNRAVCWTDAVLYCQRGEASSSKLFVDQLIQKTRHAKDLVTYLKGVRALEIVINSIDRFDSRYVSSSFLESLNSKLFRIGLHGHDHHRHGLFGYEWQRRNLEVNIAKLSAYPNFIPIFAIPFGKLMDWNEDTLKICRDLNVRPLFANGGYSTPTYPIGHRIPADSRNVRELIGNLSPFIRKYGVTRSKIPWMNPNRR